MTHPARYVINKSQKPIRGSLLNRTHPLARGLIGAWILNERTGDIAFDLSGNGQHGTLKNEAAWCPEGVDFPSGTPVIDTVNTDGILDLEGQAVTVVTSINCSAFVNGRRIFAVYQQFELVARATEKYRWGVASTIIDLASADRAKVGVNEWHTIAVTSPGAVVSGGQKIYLDGLFSASTNSVALPAVSVPLCIGAQNAAGLNDMDGSMEYFYIYNRVLSPEEIALLHREPYCMF